MGVGVSGRGDVGEPPRRAHSSMRGTKEPLRRAHSSICAAKEPPRRAKASICAAQPLMCPAQSLLRGAQTAICPAQRALRGAQCPHTFAPGLSGWFLLVRPRSHRIAGACSGLTPTAQPGLPPTPPTIAPSPRNTPAPPIRRVSVRGNGPGSGIQKPPIHPPESNQPASLRGEE